MLKRLWNSWKRLAQKIGNFQARVLLTLIYGVLVLPLGLAVRWFGDPLRIKRRPENWMPHSKEETAELDWARRQW
ncbi:MAG: hypothetical protein LAN37_00070 [Acidobacteriia bacterium]|nr:hypothetical protein [Terriglobia bacterium]